MSSRVLFPHELLIYNVKRLIWRLAVPDEFKSELVYERNTVETLNM